MEGDDQRNHEAAIQKPEDPNRTQDILEEHCPHGQQELETTALNNQ